MGYFVCCRRTAESQSLYETGKPSANGLNRILLEAKRYLHYTDKSAKEIAYELGFENPAHFSRFFKANAGINISAFNSGKYDGG